MEMFENDEETNEDESNDDDGDDVPDISLGATEEEHSTNSHDVHAWCGFKIVGDNVDKNVRASFQRWDRGTVSLHHFHSFALRDCIDFSYLLDKDPNLCDITNDIDAQDFFPQQKMST